MLCNSKRIVCVKNLIQSRTYHFFQIWSIHLTMERRRTSLIESVTSNLIGYVGLIVGSQKAIINTNYVHHGGCGNMSTNVLPLLGIQSRPSVNDVLLHFQWFIDDFECEINTKTKMQWKAGMYALVGLNPIELKTYDLVYYAYALSFKKRRLDETC